MDETHKKVVVSRDVKFDESAEENKIVPEDQTMSCRNDSFEKDSHPMNIFEDFTENSTASPSLSSPNNADPFHSEEIISRNKGIPESGGNVASLNQSSSDGCDTSSNNSAEIMTRRSNRSRKFPREWWKSASGFVANVADEKLTFELATKGENSRFWRDAVSCEMDSLKKNKTWILMPRSNASYILTNRWIFREKDVLTANGNFCVQYKARLVTRGFQQIHGNDYEETFAPVIKFTTLRLFLATVAIQDLELHQMDVQTAFSNGDLNEDIYMEQPEGFIDKQNPSHVCKLKKALYGLKQAPRQ